MPIQLTDLAKHANGAQFFTADLHVHSYGGSHDVKDATMTVEAIVDAAVANSIGILAITDHNSSKNSARSIEYARSKYRDRLLVLAGVEVTTAQGHLLVYFDPENPPSVDKFLAKIDIVKEGTGESHTAKSMADVAAIAGGLGGVCVAAHIDREKTGFEMGASGYPNWKKDIITCPAIYGLEVDDPAHLVWYSIDDEATPNGTERKKLLELRSKVPGAAARAVLGHLQNSDAHTLTAFTTAHQKRALTRFKMDALTFDSFRTALIDPDARVRATAPLPPAIHRLLGMHVEGGFLGSQTYRFNDNLTCFIGGRGTGKSTALKCVAYALGVSDDLASYDNCPDSVVVYCEDAGGVVYRYERMRDGSAEVRAREGSQSLEVAVDAFRIEYYPQGHLSEVAKDPLGNAALLQEFLDRHLHLADLRARESELLDELEQNGSTLRPLEVQAAARPAKKKLLDECDKKLKIAQDSKLKDVAAFQTKLGAEKGLAKSLDEIKTAYRKGVSLATHLRKYDDLVTHAGDLTGEADVAPHLAAAKKIIEETNQYLQSQQTAISTKMREAATKLEAELKALAGVHERLDKGVATKIAALQKAGLSATVADHKKLVTQRTTLAAEITKIDNKATELKGVRSARVASLAELASTRAEIAKRRIDQIKEVNKHLARAIDDYTVAVVYEADGLLDEFLELVLDQMHGTYFKDDMAREFCAATTPQQLAELVAEAKVDEVAKIANIGQQWAQQLVERFGRLESLHGLQVLSKPARPDILVRTKTKPTRRIPVTQLSDGQRHTILLTIAMLAESEVPLLIDQPEDDLDNAFIFASVVRMLRDVKERRQVILVTHNPNIAVLGDAEMLFPMHRKGDSGVAFAEGSIDRRETKQAVQKILEGGELAFLRRREIYGHG